MIKLKMATLLLVFACTFFCVCDSSAKTGKNYYVDALQGNDDANGLSKQTAWKSLERLKDIQLRAGDSLLFRRGDQLSEACARFCVSACLIVGASCWQ